jgi:putative hemolysin
MSEILVIALLIVANGFMVISEMSIISSRKSKLQQMAEEGNAGANSALALLDKPDQFLPTIQMATILIEVLLVAVVVITSAKSLALRISEIIGTTAYSDFISIAIIVLSIAGLILIFGEMAPKRLALANPEKIASAVAPIMNALAHFASPVVFLLNRITDFVVWCTGMKPSAEPSVTEEEIKVLIDEGTDSGVFDEAEQEIMERVFTLGDRKARTIMTPRSEIVWLDIDDSPQVIHGKIAGQRYSLFPVCKDDVDNILGIVQAKDFLSYNLIDKKISLKEMLLPPLVVPESMKALNVLERFKRTGIHLALVLDEYGSVQGLITLADLLEALVGDIPHIDDLKEPDVIKREDGSFLLNGMLPIDDFKALFDINKLPNEESGLYHTAGGFAMMHLERVPSAGDHFECCGLRFEIVDMDENRVDKLIVVPVNEEGK